MENEDWDSMKKIGVTYFGGHLGPILMLFEIVIAQFLSDVKLTNSRNQPT